MLRDAQPHARDGNQGRAVSYYDAMREEMNHAIEHDICNLCFYHVMMGLINNAESEHKFLYDEFMNAKGDRIKAENAKLRELVEEAVEAASLDDVRDWSIGHRLRLIRQARELGIETDDV